MSSERDRLGRASLASWRRSGVPRRWKVRSDLVKGRFPWPRNGGESSPSFAHLSSSVWSSPESRSPIPSSSSTTCTFLDPTTSRNTRRPTPDSSRWALPAPSGRSSGGACASRARPTRDWSTSRFTGRRSSPWRFRAWFEVLAIGRFAVSRPISSARFRGRAPEPSKRSSPSPRVVTPIPYSSASRRSDFERSGASAIPRSRRARVSA